MRASIENIRESMANPGGRFRTLAGFTFTADEEGMPRIVSSSREWVKFNIRFGGRDHLMQVFFSDDAARGARLAEIAGRLGRAGSSYLARFEWLPGEITVFGDGAAAGEAGDAAFACDVALTEIPQGTSLAYFILENCTHENVAALKSALAGFCDMAVWLLGSGITHGRMNLRNVRVGAEIKLVGYDHLRFENGGEKSGGEKNGGDDCVPLASIALYLKLLAGNPSLYDRLAGIPVAEIVAAINDSSGLMKPDRGALAAALAGFASDGKKLSLNYEALTAMQAKPETLEDGVAAINAENWSRPRSRRHYDAVEPMEEGLQCVELDGKFGFIDDKGKELIPLKYDNATGFREGRSVVVLDDLFGMIDKEGREILPPIYESVDWYCEYGVAKISIDGRFGLVDRNVAPITALEYDWMGEPSEGMFVVRLQGLYGYITTSGKPTIEPRFEDAGEFRSGVAAVTLGGIVRFIGTDGEEYAQGGDIVPPVKITVYGN